MNNVELCLGFFCVCVLFFSVCRVAGRPRYKSRAWTRDKEEIEGRGGQNVAVCLHWKSHNFHLVEGQGSFSGSVIVHFYWRKCTSGDSWI